MTYAQQYPQDRDAVEFPDLAKLLDPASIVVIGASDRPGNIGGETIRRLRKFKFPGKIWCVNRNGAAVGDVPGFESVGSLPDVPDLAIFAMPADALLSALEECVAFGIRHGIAYAAGLGEAGSDGVALQDRLVELCRRSSFRLCGPNCVGIVNAATPVTSTFATVLIELDSLKPGGISVVSQSGGIGTTLIAMADEAGFGLRHMISSGNEAVLDFADYVHALALDEGTKVIAGYLEGISDGRKLLGALAKAREMRKPVVLIKVGATASSASAAKAHTGSLVGEDRVVDAVLEEMGVIRVHSIEELFDTCMLASSLRTAQLPFGSGVGVVTFGGGNGVLAADQCAEAGLETPAIGSSCAALMRPLLVSVASPANPLDLTPMTAFREDALTQLPKLVDLLASEPGIHSILFIVGSLTVRADEISGIIRDLHGSLAKPVVVSWPSPPKGVVGKLASMGIPSFADPARAIRSLGGLARHARGLAGGPAEAGKTSLAFDWKRHLDISDGAAVVTEDRCHAILRAAGLPVAAGGLAKDEAAALDLAAELGFPVVLKGISAEVTHRAAAGLLAVDLRSAEEVSSTFRRLTARANDIGVELDGIYVQKMHKGGAELLVSAFRDPLFGMMISCGTGGGLTEMIGDVVIGRAPVSVDAAARMLGRLRIAKYGKDELGPFDAAPIASYIARFSELAATAPWPGFVFELNPVKWSRQPPVAVDGLLIVN